MPEKKSEMSTTTLYGLVLGGCGIAIVVAVVGMRFLSERPPLPQAAAPPPVAETAGGEMRYSEAYVKAQIDEDVKEFKVAPITITELAKPLYYANELAEPKRLKPSGDTLETEHLKLRTAVIKEWATTEGGQGFRYEHIVLSITNRSAKPVAYRVATEVAGIEKCKQKAAMAQNAIVLGPGETVQRTECFFQPKAMLIVKAVEIEEVTPLGYVYLSRIEPSPVLFDPRTYAGHTVDKRFHVCQFVPWREVEADVAVGASWKDVIDFYARHNCSEYSYYKGYRRWTVAGTLPAHQ